MEKLKVLLAEDDENLGSLLKEYMIAKDYETDWFVNGELAYKNFVKSHYDLCVLDVMMPIKDGITLAKDIRMLNASIPIIFLTAKSQKEDILRYSLNTLERSRTTNFIPKTLAIISASFKSWGMDKQGNPNPIILSFPIAFAHKADVTALSMPPLNPTTIPSTFAELQYSFTHC